MERRVRELVFALTRARVLARLSAQAQAQSLVLARAQASDRALAQVSAQVSVPVLVQASVQVLVQVSVQVSSPALAQSSVQVLAQAQMSVQSCPPPCRLLWRRSSDQRLRLVVLQERGAWIAVVAPRSPCK